MLLNKYGTDLLDAAERVSLTHIGRDLEIRGQLKSYRDGRKQSGTYWTTWSWKDCCCRGTYVL